ncbi:MAG: Abi family protein [Verrucomicrobiales bacterium]|jgi:hypothetical protein|nr:Abi family protein [Verrucomicrobiales bacterium]
MDFNQFQKFFSAMRVNRYLQAVHGESDAAIKLYRNNLKIARAFHPLLGIVEVALRNRLNDLLTVYFHDADWIINQKNGFMSDSSLTNSFLRDEVTRAEKRLKRMGVPVTAGKIIAEQSFGFWSDLFAKYHYRILQGRVIKAFVNLPPNCGRKEVYRKLGQIRKFRNRINHNEPVCFKGDTADFTEALKVHQSIVCILQWLGPELSEFVTGLDEVRYEISSAAS